MSQKGANIILVFIVSGTLVFAFANDLRADTSPFIQNLQSSFLGSFTRSVGNYFKPILRTLNGSSRTEVRAGADVRSAINRILLFSFGESVGTGSSLSPEDAISIRQQNDSISENAIPFSSDDISELNVNAPSLFKEQTQFQKNILLQGDLTADGSHIELGGGTLSASNVLYGLLAGDGISIVGNTQRPTISATQQLWQLNDLILSPRLPDAIVSIPGELQLQDILRFSSDASLFFGGRALNYISDDLRGAWTIATSTDAVPLVSLDIIGRGNISFGTTSPRAFVTVAGGEDQDRLFVGSANSSDLFIDRFGNVGIGTDAPSQTLTVSGTFAVTDRATFETSPRFASILDCVGSGAVVTDSEGDIQCGGFIFDTSPQFLSVTSCQGGGVLETDSEGRLVCGEDDVGRRSTSPGGANTQVQFNLNGGFAGSTQFSWDNNTNRLSIATTSFETALNVGGSLFLSGGLGLGNATTTSGVLETSGLAYFGSLIKVGSGTSTFTGGIYANALSFNLPSCTEALETDANGAIICGTDATSGTGGANITVSGGIVSLDATLYSMGDIFATTSSASIYASSTIQATGNIIGYNAITLGTTTPYRGAKALIIDQAEGENFQNPLIYVGDNGTSTPFFFITQKGVIGFGTSSPSNHLLNPGDVAIGRNGATSDLFLSGGLGVGTATTTDGVLETTGKIFTAGNILGNGHITLTGTGTSTFTGGIFANDLRINLPSCNTNNALTTNTSGGVICDFITTVASAGGTDGQIQYNNGGTAIDGAGSLYWNDTINRLGLGTTTPGSFFAINNRAGLSDGKVPLFTVASSTPSATTTLFTILNTGDVGIGTTSPAYDLSINDDVYVSGGLGIGNATTTDGVLETSGLAYIGGLIKVGSGTSTFTGGIFANDLRINLPSCNTNNALTTNTSGGVICDFITTVASAGGTDGQIQYNNGGTAIDGAGSLYWNDTINRLGLGTTTPGSFFAINNRAGLSDGKVPLFTVASSTPSATTTLFTILNTGDVGIGTTSPAYDLSVNDDVYVSGGLGIGNATTTDGVLETSGLAYIGGLIKV